MSILLNSDDSVEEYEEGTVLFREGDLPEHFYIILSGGVTCFKLHERRLVPILTAGDQEIVGEDCVLSDSSSYFYSAIVSQESKLIKIEKSEVYEYLNYQKDWIKNILKNISDKIKHTTEVIAEHKIMDNRLIGDIDFSQEEEAKFKQLLKIN